MRIAILDPFAGISGDMTLGALLDAGVGEDWLFRLPTQLGLSDVSVRVDKVERAGLSATKVEFIVEGGREHGRHVGDLIETVRSASLSEWVREQAVRAFELIGEAESRVHGIASDKVHLHEVGAADAMLDIVGAAAGFERLRVEQIYNLPVALGDGWVEAAHGKLPVPAPATLNLLEGCDVRRDAPVSGEATTPTGAALIRALSAGTPPTRWRITSSHWGAGDRNPSEYPNALRLILAEAAPEAGLVEVIATDLDDLQPEYIQPLRDAVFDAGAVDCVVWTTQGKKGRVSIRVEALAPAEAADRVTQALFMHSTTTGVRRWPATRSTLERRQVEVDLEGDVRIRIKVWEGPFGRRLKPEYADVIAAASRLGRPALEVAHEAERRADKLLHDGEQP